MIDVESIASLFDARGRRFAPMIVINDDSSDDDEFKPLPSLLRAVASPSRVRARRRRDDDATRDAMDGMATPSDELSENSNATRTRLTRRNETTARRAIDGDDDADEATNGDAADDRGRRWDREARANRRGWRNLSRRSATARRRRGGGGGGFVERRRFENRGRGRREARTRRGRR